MRAATAHLEVAAAIEDAWLAPVLETLASPAFRADVEALEGYDGSRMGWFS